MFADSSQSPPAVVVRGRLRYIAKDRDNADLKRKALTAITAKMARTVHAVIKTGSDYRPFFEGPIPSGRTSLSKCREGASATL